MSSSPEDRPFKPSSGTTRAGKLADFTVSEADPYEVAPAMPKDAPIWGTVLAGFAHPIANEWDRIAAMSQASPKRCAPKGAATG